MSWTVPTPEPVDGPMTGPGRPVLEGYLSFHRTTLVNICAGLTGEQLAERALPSTPLSLLGILRHLAKVERIWLRQRIAGQDVPALYGGAGNTVDFDDTDAGHAADVVAQLCEEWRLADEAVAGIALSHEITVHGEAMSLQMVYLHLIGEYARHNGHADLLREAIDGITGR